MRKVLAFGTYDVFHPGHVYFLQEARKHGDHLTVVIALDETVQQIKKHTPRNDQETRRKVVASQPYVDVAVLGRQGDKYAIVAEISPDVICLGYDQQTFTAGLAESLAARGMHPEIIRIEAFQPEKYKSSKL